MEELKMKWVRSQDGVIFGVCKGLAKTFDIPVGVFRLLWIASLIFFGAGLWLYLLLAVSLPREDKVVEALSPVILGVCSRIAVKTDVEVGVVRFLAICLSLMSMGATLVGYIVLYFVMDQQKKPQTSESRPSTPPATL
jgi:phage shock protein PspC (stress-responsive transcriptional regulator)